MNEVAKLNLIESSNNQGNTLLSICFYHNLLHFSRYIKEKEACEHVREEYCYEGGKFSRNSARIIIFTFEYFHEKHCKLDCIISFRILSIICYSIHSIYYG